MQFQGLSRNAIFVCMCFELWSEGLSISLCFSGASSLSTSGESYALNWAYCLHQPSCRTRLDQLCFTLFRFNFDVLVDSFSSSFAFI